ncbi:hypothetical protein FSP39_000914 [Pinctada imbricata]|uniref:Centrosomal protein POC5 n=1 Tax=Pinctada imbricata TaxID=66713 RepID=A0AA88XXJ4_PINIB|nr:hypothetical protein FSP39_000914 [Pinctada imbricata]
MGGGGRRQLEGGRREGSRERLGGGRSGTGERRREILYMWRETTLFDLQVSKYQLQIILESRMKFGFSPLVMSSLEGEGSIPDLPPDSPGSSVSTRLMDEYEELLKYAAVVPGFDPSQVPQQLADHGLSFPPPAREKLVRIEQDCDEQSDVTPVLVQVTREMGLPDLSQSTIHSKQSDSQTTTPRNREDVDTSKSKVPPSLFQSGLSSNTSHDFQTSHTEEQRETETSYLTSVDQDSSRMEHLLDQWTSDLKRNVLAEFGQSKMRIVEKSRVQYIKEQERSAFERNKLQNEIESLKELLHTYEQSIQRKDQVISNLTQALQKQREKQEMTKTFCEWKIKHDDQKREAFTSKLAYQHHERCLKRQMWNSWHSMIENKWKARVEKACQAKAQEICVQLTDEYEAKIRSLNESLQAARDEISRLHVERDKYEESMKKAFMRGVCALNLEAMTMFQPEDGPQQAQGSGGPVSGEYSNNLEGSLPEKDYSAPKTIPQEPVFTPSPSDKPVTPRVVTSQGARSASANIAQSTATLMTKPVTQRSKTSSVRVTSKVDTGRPVSAGLGRGPGVAPPMSSVVVERHQPVTKQTIGQATAKKYTKKVTITEVPSQPLGGSSFVHKKLAGQVGGATIPPHIQTVKVVE